MGDLKNSVARLRKLLRVIRYPHACELTDASAVADLLRVLHYTLLDYSRHVAAFILEKGYDLNGKTDARFIDVVFRLMRDEFRCFPSLSSVQFLSPHFLERKVQVVADMIAVVVERHGQSVRDKRKQEAVWSKPREPRSKDTRVENHVMPATQPNGRHLLEHLSDESRRKQRQQLHQKLGQQRRRQYSPPLESRRLDEMDTSAKAQSLPANSPRSQLETACETLSWGKPSLSPPPSVRFKSSSPQYSDHDNNNDTQASVPPSDKDHDRSCHCSESKAEVQEVLVTLSQQISDLTSAVLSRLAVVETRLNAVEKHVEGRLMQPSSTASYTSKGSPADTAEKKPRSAIFQSSWPPDPDMFASHVDVKNS